MAAEFRIRVLSPMGEVLNTMARSLRVTAWDGQVGVLAGHAPMVELLAIGPTLVTEADGTERWLATVEGIMRVKRDEVVLLVAASEEAPEIDVERAHRALQRARERLGARPAEVDISRAELARSRAMNRLRVAEHAGR